MATLTYDLEPSKLTFRDALDQAEVLARQNLPQVLHERLSCAVALVKSGAVLQMDDGAWEVGSASVPGKQYHINGTGCPCEDAHYRAPQGRCKHVLSVFLARKALALMGAQTALAPQAAPPAGGSQEEPPAAEPVLTRKRVIPAHFLQQLQGKPFIKFVGLLQMAHEEGLVSLTEEWTFNSEELSLAHAVATFADGRMFAGSGDSTPQNAKNIGLAWRRMALTRAKARALRDGLAIDMCSVEEME
jgi:hypothetical protein